MANPSKCLGGNSIAVCYDISGALLAAGVLPSLQVKRLRRLPHLFSRVLELPIGAWSSVQIHETSASFTFSATLPVPDLVVPEHVRAEVTEIIPGITKVSISGARRAMAALDELDIPPWRFRLPDTTLLESSIASCGDDGILVLTVPKSQPMEENIASHPQDLDTDMFISDNGYVNRESTNQTANFCLREPGRANSDHLDASHGNGNRNIRGNQIVAPDAVRIIGGGLIQCLKIVVIFINQFIGSVMLMLSRRV